MDVGTYVINQGYVCRIIAVLYDGSLVVENARLGKWIADPNLCTEYKEEK